MSNETRMFIFLPNEHISQTRIERQVDESMNDRNDRAIRSAADWYASCCMGHVRHVSRFQHTDFRFDRLKDQITDGELILLSNDKLNREKAQEDGLISMSMREYVSTFVDEYPELMDLLAATDEAAQATLGTENIYAEHLPLSNLNSGIKTKRYCAILCHVMTHSGHHYHMHSDFSKECFAFVWTHGMIVT